MLVNILKIVFVLLILVSSLFFGFFVGKYLKDYRIFQMIFAKIMGHAAEEDRIRRLQMREAFHKSQDLLSKRSDDKGPTLMEKIYRQISMTGVSSVIPGFSESSFLVIAVAIGLVIFALGTITRNFVIGIAFAAAYTFLIVYILNVLAHKRKVKVEVQLLDFVNTVATASRQYSNLIDIFGCTYENFSAPLSKALEECYIEAKTINNTDIAVQHLKDKFDSAQFSFVLDNLLLCSKETGDYFNVATDLSKTVAIYIASYEKKQAILRNAKITLTVMVVLTAGIIYALGIFLGGLSMLLGSTAGTILAILMVLLYLYGMNLKVE